MSADGSTATVAAEGSPHQQQAQMSPSQQLSAAAATPVQSVAQTNVGGDSLVCQWSNCGERTSTAELLYDHVCERHVGRKSTNNLNLTCQWGNCRTTTVKRDHITSHIRVHVPLKPHKCDFCGKAFKRPQDLKKHVKTHADDSVLLRSPEPSRANQNGPGGGYQPANSNKLVADLQTLAATASGYYPDHNAANGSYYQNGLGTGSYHSAAAAPAGSAYGPVYYAVNQSASLATDYEVRKRAAFDALNEFFGDAKRRLIDPATYYDVGHRLAMGGLQPAMVSSAAAAAGGYSGAESYATSAAHLPQQHYTLPLPNLRTKNDLLNIDHFLEQLQSTVYENSNGAAAAGVHQAGAHYIPTGMGYGRSSHSPPTVGHSSTSGLGGSNVLAPLATPQADTPALTPASSVMSYSSGAGHSPPSHHASHGLSPTRSSNAGLNGAMYPTLPAVSAMSDMNVGAGYSTSGAPASSLASGFDADGRRRYSGGLLQRQAPTRASVEPMDEDTPTGSPKPLLSGSDGEAEGERTKSRDTPTVNVMSPSMIDPSMRSPSVKSDDGAAEGTPSREESQQEQWVENIRMIEALRELVKNRLEAGEFDSEDGSAGNADEASKDVDMDHGDSKTEQDKDAESLYPVLRAIQED